MSAASNPKGIEPKTDKNVKPSLRNVLDATRKLRSIINVTPLSKSMVMSERYDAEILLKREDLQIVRSYKIRGAYNKISSLTRTEMDAGVVTASAGNHAQGVAYSCNILNIRGKIFMPATTPLQKITQVKMFGRDLVEIILVGDTYDDAHKAAIEVCAKDGATYIPPFDDPKVIEGQATVGFEILDTCQKEIDFLFLPIGGGGLASGVGSYFKQISPKTRIIGVEPAGAASMKASIEAGHVVTLDSIDKFVDGAAVKRVGDLTFEICRSVVDEIVCVPEGKICTTILNLYNEEALVVEPAGALSISALDMYRDQIKGKTVVCILSGSNNDILRTEEIKERSMLYEGLKHYFLVRFPQRAGALREFLNDVLGPQDDITHFEYRKKNSREQGPALIGIVLKKREDFDGIILRLQKKGFYYQYLNDQSDLFQYIV
ncbi:MAG: threonine ammonia-lyase [Bacteroidota bacterium]|jgi:threonine dehydratase